MAAERVDSEFSSSEDEILSGALKEATDTDFLKPNLFSTGNSLNSSESFESKQVADNTDVKSLKSNLQREDDFLSFGVSATFKQYVAKKLHAILERTIELHDEDINDTSTTTSNNKEECPNFGIKLLSSSNQPLIIDEPEVFIKRENYRSSKRKIIDETKDIAHFQQVAVDPEYILSKRETLAWAERNKGTVFRYKKLKNGILLQQD